MQAIKRAIKYKEKTYETKKEIVKKCIKDLKRERSRKEEGRWERKRSELLERAEMRKKQIRNERGVGN